MVHNFFHPYCIEESLKINDRVNFMISVIGYMSHYCEMRIYFHIKRLIGRDFNNNRNKVWIILDIYDLLSLYQPFT